MNKPIVVNNNLELTKLVSQLDIAKINYFAIKKVPNVYPTYLCNWGNKPSKKA